jgi:hypothetical protein
MSRARGEWEKVYFSNWNIELLRKYLFNNFFFWLKLNPKRMKKYLLKYKHKIIVVSIRGSWI